MNSLEAKPFKRIAADIFQVNKINYLTIVCKHSGWLSLFKIQQNNPLQVMSVLRRYFSQWGIASTISTDGSSVFASQEMEQFLITYGVRHESSSYLPCRRRSSPQHKLIEYIQIKYLESIVLAIFNQQQ